MTTTTIHSGYVKSINLDRGFGFLAEPDQPDIFFHVDELGPGLEWDETLTGRRVKFKVFGTGRGPKAFDVRPAD